ncbi:allatostatin C [Musca autumnalis]|uniref:allatostatin C n=1 Tax=Musca autumnalis TaxID=221902 RepID=UPI003CED4218
MMKISKMFALFAIFTVTVSIAVIEARPQNTIETTQNMSLDSADTDIDDLRSLYYDLPVQQNVYPNLPLDRLQMMIAQYRPTSYLRSPISNDVYRLPETKRQVKYRQCYFNPISCFKK